MVSYTNVNILVGPIQGVTLQLGRDSDRYIILYVYIIYILQRTNYIS